jgi:hypothetical protein
MNESIVKNTRPDAVAEFEGNWMRYQATHALSRNNAGLEQFVKQNTSTGTTVSIDSFAPRVVATCHYEFERNRIIWEHQSYDPVEFVKVAHKLPDNSGYNNVVWLGAESFKYMTVPEYCEYVSSVLDCQLTTGNAIVCLPLLHLQYHRLRYNTQQIIKHIDSTFGPYHVQDVYYDTNECYLSIKRASNDK